MAEGDSEFVEMLKSEWADFSPALQASSEGKTAGLGLLVANAVRIARMMREELGEVDDPSAERSLLVVLCANAYRVAIEPEPSVEICQILASAAVQIMELEDALDVAEASVGILREPDDD